MSQQEFLSNQPIVIDNGTAVTKAGLSGVDRPSCEIRTYVGSQKYDRVMMNGFAPEDDLWIGKDLEVRRGLCHLEYPIKHGIIENWDMMELIWKHIYSKSQLGLDSREHPVFLSQSAISPNKQTEKMAEIFFESFDVPALFIAPQPLLSLYSSGRGTGLVVDIGDGVSTYFPVYDGFVMTPHINRVDLGGHEMTKYLQLLLRKSGYIFSTTSEFEVIREMKETCVECSTTDTSTALHNSSVDYILPDGRPIKLGEERSQCAEVLFDPTIIGYESAGVSEMIRRTVDACDLELRSHLYSNILLSGGVTLTRNFGKRTMEELKGIAPPNTKVRMYSPPERARSAWVGGCVLASLSPFKNMWISKEEYEMDGIQCVHKKSLDFVETSASIRIQIMSSFIVSTRDQIGGDLCNHVEVIIAENILNGKRTTIALSGSSQPILLAPFFMEAPIDWDWVDFYFSDERCVSLEDPDSNFGAWNSRFFSIKEIKRERIFTINETCTCAKDIANQYNDILSTLPQKDGYAVFDILILGMGPDGHTCSLFPNHPIINCVSVNITSIADSPKPPNERITMTLPVLNSAKHVFFLVTGKDKADILAAIREGTTTVPAARVNPTDGELIWFVDHMAMST